MPKHNDHSVCKTCLGTIRYHDDQRSGGWWAHDKRPADGHEAEPQCCHLHQPTDCCDPGDCGPCCEDCPTCPSLKDQEAQILVTVRWSTKTSGLTAEAARASVAGYIHSYFDDPEFGMAEVDLLPSGAEEQAGGFLAAWLTEDERRHLAFQALNVVRQQDDPRFCAGMFEDRERIRERWQQIADAFHPDPADRKKLCGSCDHQRGEHDVKGCNDCDCVAPWGDDQP